MQILEIIDWAKTMKSESREKKLRYEPKNLPKIENYIQMIIDRGVIIQKETIRMQRYMEEIQDALTRLSSYGVSIPGESKQTAKTQENPLKAI